MFRNFVLCLVVCCLMATATARRRRKGARAEEEEDSTMITTSDENHREGKLFSLFSVVSFTNSPCHSADDDDDDDRKGTCMTSEECSDSGGSAEGHCAAGFGVCCVYVLDDCGGTVSRNGTYVQNVGYPRGNSTHQECKFDFSRIQNDICQIRLDFERFETVPPPADTGDCSLSGDVLLVTSPTGAGAPSNLCGTLTGQHMYIETGDSGDAGSMAVTTSLSSVPRTYNVRVDYVECDSPLRAPEGCLQYFTGSAGNFRSYGHNSGTGVQPDGQEYAFCFRREKGFCSYQIQESGDLNSFGLVRDVSEAVATLAACSDTVDPETGGNYIRVQTDEGVAGEDLRCGGVLSNAEGNTTPGVVRAPRGFSGPFRVDYFLTDVADGTVLTNPLGAGVSLEYAHIPC